MTQKMMKAVLLTGHGGPEKLDYRADVPIPQPSPGEVLIKVGACGVNNTDIWTREGAYGLESEADTAQGWRGSLSFPRIQGGDIVGCIVEVGASVARARLGERVIVCPTIDIGQGSELVKAGCIGSERDGGFAEYATAPAANALVVDCPLSDAELATFPIAYLTAEHMLNRARVKAGEIVLITGASGGVGSALIQLAQAREARVLAITSAGKADQARALGAEFVITRDVSALPATVAAALKGHTVDVVADVVAGPLFPDLLTILRPAGRYVTAGAIAGPVVMLDLRTLYLKHLELIGSTMGTLEEFTDVVTYIITGKIKPLLAGTYPLTEINRAQQDFVKKKFFGKLVMVP